MDKNPIIGGEADAEQLGRLISLETLSLDVVSAFAGDRPLTPDETALMEKLKGERGAQFYCDLLYSITHRHFPPEAAEGLWNRILQHKYNMSSLMQRNIRIAVASLDYLSNLTATLHAATVIDEEQIGEIVRLSLRDCMTGLFNHAYFFQKVDMELARYVRYGTTVSIMMLDVDDFKSMNDQYGHQEGDRILAMIGSIIKRTAREPDVCCRYGGEEFAIILPSTDAAETLVFAERLRARLARVRFQGRQVTVSIGVASCGEGARTPESLVKKADMALYQAKRNGKNQVVVSGNSTPASG